MSMPGAFSPHAPSSPKMAPTATASSAAASSASAGDVKKPDAFLTPPLRLGESSDAYSLHSANANANANAPGRFYDDDPAELLPGRGGDEDDLPPLYTDDPSADGVRDPLLQIQDLHSKQHGLVPPHLVVPDTGNEYHIDRRLDADPSFLQRHIEACAAIPPRAFVRLRGTHTETVRRGDKTERQTHVDFDVRLELTPFLYSDDCHAHELAHPAHRRQLLPRSARHLLLSSRALEAGRPGLAEWCHRYCASHAGLKTFQLRREVTGWNEDLVRSKLETLVRATGYQGHVAVTFPLQGETVTVYNDAATNRWRLLRWVRVLCVLTLTILLTWPWLFFRTARFEVAVVEWPMSRRSPRHRQGTAAAAAAAGRRDYVSLSEEQWYNMWARAVRRAVLERRQGTLDQGDLVAAEGAQGATFDGQTEAQAVVGNAVGNFVRAGVSAMNAVNVRFGWGGDH
ncbi:uncharacterized protein VDAG_05066 [Verticillium dahliae VdLs.17]|uniref:Uncharacterized protein n=1 Tax=Verticillium dahliae (strain VdLs.17 / ATCC MYA-4575 / FGSC 10137) TaxID=498257 RepID=G2X4I4_VERDV|nr:uncharacterized protein VDAG_05066 [Verticillium dahliae VdLs.17]EGY23628.1 hypothetical protein VDAG_05066 [Verticillium dahliae VdLs.17]